MLKDDVHFAHYRHGRLETNSPGWATFMTAFVESIVADGVAMPTSAEPGDFRFVRQDKHNRLCFFGCSGLEGLLIWAVAGVHFRRCPNPDLWMQAFPAATAVRGMTIADAPVNSLAWQRDVQQLSNALQTLDGPLLLGGTQVLVDGGRVILTREKPDPTHLAGFWIFLPNSVLADLQASSFTRNPTDYTLAFVPLENADLVANLHCLTEEQIRDYPESHYEKELQFAIDHEDQKVLDRLLARRSSAETIRLAASLIFAAFAVLIASKVLTVVLAK
jgi:hypothetical protein